LEQANNLDEHCLPHHYENPFVRYLPVGGLLKYTFSYSATKYKTENKNVFEVTNVN
jgi:hypothetical protein